MFFLHELKESDGVYMRLDVEYLPRNFTIRYYIYHLQSNTIPLPCCQYLFRRKICIKCIILDGYETYDSWTTRTYNLNLCCKACHTMHTFLALTAWLIVLEATMWLKPREVQDMTRSPRHPFCRITLSSLSLPLTYNEWVTDRVIGAAVAAAV